MTLFYRNGKEYPAALLRLGVSYKKHAYSREINFYMKACPSVSSPNWVTFTANIGGSSGGITMIGTKSGGTMNWNTCSTTCYNSTESGFTDWRMPTAGELHQASVNGSPAFPGGKCACYVWTSLADPSADNWAIYFESTGARSSDGSTTTYYCRCVR